MFMTNKALLEETKEIVKLHAPRILKELGLEVNDGILDRISITDRVGADVPHGCCHATTDVKKVFGIATEQKYTRGSASIEINPITFFYYMGKNGELKKAPFFVRFFKSRLRRIVLFTLAHELRHYWQHYTGEYYENEMMFFGRNIIPYEHRWCERDANKFGSSYLNSTK